ncbi:hypothetical protein LUZ60_009283 [Juncus effusus]|nr:hypothetical protein LUZ60_009283 [Juncus effusus]
MGTVVGEALVSAVVKQLVKTLSSPGLEEAGLLWKFTSELQNMKQTLTTLEAVLKDAEKRSGSVNEEILRLWLKRVKTAAYEIGDMLSGFDEKIPKKKEKVLANMVQNVGVFFSTSNQLILPVVMAHKIKAMRKKLDFIAAEQAKYNFNRDTNSTVQDTYAASRATTSELDGDTILGRKEEKEELVRMLLDDSNEEVDIIPIVGLGGLGKTTLAKLLYNDDKIIKAFKFKAWVYVSTKFNLKKIGEDLMECLKEGPCTYGSKNIVCNKVNKELKGKRFLVVLDDIWEENGENLEDLKQMLKNSARGSKVLLTTCSTRIARMMCGNDPHSLKVLSDEECWILFSQRAFMSEAEITNEKLEVGKEIVKKCHGVPLAAKALGYTMRLKEGIDSWFEMRDNYNREFEEERWSSSQNTILPTLKLSYYNMPSHLKMCFTYCSIFPKGCIRKTELIQEWIGLGFIQEGGRQNSVRVGEEYVRHLLGLSFLQCDDYFSEENPVLHMHDLVNDPALSIANDEILLLDGREENVFNADYCRYARVMNYNEASSVCKRLPKTLRALYLENCTIKLKSKCFYKSSKVFNKIKGLRVLCLERNNFEGLPKFIGKLKQLRYLRAHNLEIQTLPKSISHLNNLIALDLSGAAFHKVPSYISKLGKLCFLNLSCCKHLRQLNDSITKLKNLKHLDLSWCTEIETLPTALGNLSNLSSFNLSHCEKIQELPESVGAIESLEHLNLSFCGKLKKLPEFIVNHCNLRVLKLNDCYDLQAFPDSLNNLSNLENLDLSNCKNLTKLPNFSGDLRQLKVLKLSNCSGLESLPNSIGRLVSLENLDISDCCNLKEVPKHIGNLHKLRSLNLSGCGTNSLPESIGKLTKLEFLELPQTLTLPSIKNLKNLKKLERFYVLDSNIGDLENLNHLEGELQIYNLENEKTPQKSSKLLSDKSKLGYLHLSWNNSGEAESSDSGTRNILENLRPHKNLQGFTLLNCPAKALPDWMINISITLPNLTKMILDNLPSCNNLPPLGQLQNLRKLLISSLPGIKKVDNTFSGGDQPFIRLTKFELRNMENLEECCTLISNEGEENVFMFPNLVRFHVIKCSKLKFKPSLPDCTDLVISENDEMILSRGFADISNYKTLHACIKSSTVPENHWGLLDSFSNLKDLELQKCKELRSLPETICGLTSLESLEINNCNNLVELGENLKYLGSLKKLEITLSENLVSLPESLDDLISLEELIIRYCPKLESLPDSIKNLSLKTLRVRGCPKLLENCLQRDKEKIVHIPDFSPEEGEK